MSPVNDDEPIVGFEGWAGRKARALREEVLADEGVDEVAREGVVSVF